MRRHDIARAKNGLAQCEGAFLACSFWDVDNIAMLSRMDGTRQMFERLLTTCNDVDLMSEEYDIGEGEMLGNIPEALSRPALVNSVHNLEQGESPARMRSGGNKKKRHE